MDNAFTIAHDIHHTSILEVFIQSTIIYFFTLVKYLIFTGSSKNCWTDGHGHKILDNVRLKVKNIFTKELS